MNRFTSAAPRRSVLAGGLALAGSWAAPWALSWGARAAFAAPPPTAFIVADAVTERYSQKWALSCEFAALHTALRLLGHVVPEDVMRPLLGSGEDPDETFRGEIQANQTLVDYGVHAKGIARLVDLLRARGHVPRELGARLLYDLDSVRAAIAAGQPVVAWLPLDLRDSLRVPTRLSTGKIVNLIPAEHALTLRGYDGTYFYALDPHGGLTPRYEAGALWRGMSLFDDPALAIGPLNAVQGVSEPAPAPPPAAPPAVAPPAPPPSSVHFPETGITLEGGFFRAYLSAGGRDLLGVPVTAELTEIDPDTGEAKQVLYTEAGRLEWLPATGSFALGYAGQDLLGDAAGLDPARPLGGAIGRFASANGGLPRFGFSLSEEVPLPPDSALLPHPMAGAVGQWFQTGLLVWEPASQMILPGHVGLALARERGYVE
ncbi:MAG TPA: C39 family peptidase [Chloroflexota bacterium]|nr:C39 family peptidase [Chloroflexota bacterium]